MEDGDMSRINTNVTALVAQNQLARNNQRLDLTLERLSTGLRINRGADDPAGLIISENLRSEISGIGQALDNSQRASNIIATSEGALNEVAALLNDLQSLIIEAANTGGVSEEEIRANQLQIDSAIESITRIANSTRFGGRRLLDGSLDYTLSGVNANNVANVSVQGVTFGTAAFVPVNISVTQSAQPAQLFFATSNVGSQPVNIEVAGPNGVTALSFAASTTASAIVAAVNLVSDSTGITAALISAGTPSLGLVFTSNEFGSDAFLQVEALTSSVGAFDVTNAGGAQVIRDSGRDVRVSINGASALGDGLDVKLNTTGLSLQFSVDPTFNTLGSTSFSVTGGGATFQLGGGISTNEQKSIGIQSIAATRLGDTRVGFLSQITDGEQFSLINGAAQTAQQIVNAAIKQVSTVRGRLGAFEKNTLDTNINQLQITRENLIAAESVIRDADFAQQTSELTRAQILQQAGTAVLAIANQSPSNVLSLLQ
jgi:flagellin